MLAKKFRLTHHEFLLAKKSGKSFKSIDASIVVAANSLDYSRFAVVTSTKLHKNAVVRNKLRRQIYDLLGAKSLGSYDFLVFPRNSMLKLSSEELGSKFNSLLSKIPGLS